MRILQNSDFFCYKIENILKKDSHAFLKRVFAYKNRESIVEFGKRVTGKYDLIISMFRKMMHTLADKQYSEYKRKASWFRF